jgi:TetR/AcrR family transcriptional regulator of autoinduction and epiphytic fitness
MTVVNSDERTDERTAGEVRPGRKETPPESASQKERRADGRVQRGRRNREAVVAAFLALIEEGEPRPTARAIAERAGVSVRSVFQHFADLEQIYAVAGRQEAAKLAAYLEPLDPSLPLADRLDAFVARRRALLDKLDPVARAARLREPFSSQLRANKEEFHRAARAQCEATFAPELSRLPPGERRLMVHGLVLAASWASWYCLREELHLEAAEAEAVMRKSLGKLLET